MGRFNKSVITHEGIDRRQNGYYSTPSFVADFISQEMINLNPKGTRVFDPCVGKEELLGKFYSEGKQIHGIDIVDYGVHEKASFEQLDFIELYRRTLESSILTTKPELHYDFYIANPPYNCHESEYIRKHKRLLSKIFAVTGVANMYSMFVSALVDIAKPGSVIGLIANDSFLNSKMHQSLREKILLNCIVTHLILCPVDLFWHQKSDVRTCILIMVKGNPKDDYYVTTLNRAPNTQSFEALIRSRSFSKQRLTDLILSSHKDSKEFVVGCPLDILALFNNPRLGETFKCVTGISTGDDSKYLSKDKTNNYSVPFYKNPSTRRFYTEPDAYLRNDFLNISNSVPNFIIRNKDILFKPGITCSSMGVPFGACAFPEQATFGVNANIFPHESDRYWLLSYLNSSLVTYFVRGIILRTNMITSGYVSRIPIIHLSKESKESLSFIGLDAIRRKVTKPDYLGIIEKIDDIVFRQAALSEDSKDLVLKFNNNLLKAT